MWSNILIYLKLLLRKTIQNNEQKSHSRREKSNFKNSIEMCVLSLFFSEMFLEPCKNIELFE